MLTKLEFNWSRVQILTSVWNMVGWQIVRHIRHKMTWERSNRNSWAAHEILDLLINQIEKGNSAN